MSTWDESTSIIEWTAKAIKTMREIGPAEKADTAVRIQNEFMSFTPKQKATAFIYLLGRVVTDDYI